MPRSNSKMQRERFSLEELARLHAVLESQKELHEGNRELIVETLRSIAELMIWGDQHEPRFFEFFLEKHLLKQFRRILSQPGARTGNVAQQVLQTLSIMIQNIRNETSIYFLFSNNQINEMISIKLDFEDEEVLGYYISFLKAIALKFNEQTVQLFLIMDGTDDKLPTSFPLYTEALKLFRHKESMVRAAVRTLTLSVYSIRDELVRNFVLSPPASNYFRHLAMYLTEQCQLLDGTLMSAEASSASFSTDALDNILAEVEDVLVYTNDVLATGCQRVSAMMAVNFWQHFLVPCCFAPLARGLDSSSYSDPASAWIGEYQAATRPVCALYVAERVFALMGCGRLVNSLACALLGVDPRECDPAGVWSTRDLMAPVVGRAGKAGGKGSNPLLYRQTILKALSGTGCQHNRMWCEQVQVAAAAVRLVFAVIQSGSLSIDVMDAVGLLPYRKRKRRDLFNSLTGERKTLGAEPDELQEEETHITSTMIPRNGQTEDKIHSAVSLEFIDALFQLLQMRALPASALWYSGWVLGQLVPVLQRGLHHSRVMTQRQHDLLNEARSLVREETMDEVAGLWCDALPVIISHEWPLARKGITTPTLKTHGEAVLAWMTATTAQAQVSDGDSSKSMYTQPQTRGNLSLSARAASHMAVAAQRLVALVQIQMLLSTGEIPPAPPLPDEAGVSNSARRPEVKEGDQVDLAGIHPKPMPCRVAFSRGAERSVYFALHGGVMQEGQLQEAGCWKSPPVVLLADPASTRINAGIVLSTAPLLGADPAVDGSHPHWLHLHVRPSMRGLTKAMQLNHAGPGSGSSSLLAGTTLSGKHLQDGHWVLAFPDADAAASAKAAVEERAAQFRAVYCQLLAPLLWNAEYEGNAADCPPKTEHSSEDR
eukprot:CAMPEP_0177609508 /NCGR_PEP_ID=MMETSP0419_2-20121207/19136_1 /TAXON_ID=582737 /ORGANISM="Tetraselmis sp., Strain GSL018" /LENGTH=882 /DNA_ID=CAMNT_0019104457 /DNA_START=372 /DNA_END=3016 /DNA_ORIENTATION=+